VNLKLLQERREATQILRLSRASKPSGGDRLRALPGPIAPILTIASRPNDSISKNSTIIQRPTKEIEVRFWFVVCPIDEHKGRAVPDEI